APGQGRPPAPAAPQPQAPGPAAPQPAAPQAPAPSADMAQGAAQVRNMWPGILEAVKNRRRFTWILLSQNAQVAGFDGTTLQLGFLNAGARDNFASSGSEDVLKQALSEQFGVQWKIEAIIDPSGGAAPPSNYGGGGGYGGRPGQPGGAPAPQAAGPRPVPQHAPGPGGAPQGQQPPSGQAQASSGPAAGYEAQRPAGPQPVAPEDDVPEEDDPDLVESALSGHDLIVRELGATVLEEYTNE
ncbi:DNA polymerase III subunit gamma and tau, partial [Streptomyces coeruleoprunus]